jgi:hypothetical protein
MNFFEPVIGRHGLASSRKLLWKVSVQPLHNYQEKLVDGFPHHPQDGRSARRPLKVIQPLSMLSPEDTRGLPTVFSTAQSDDLPDENSCLYPQSTEPTITTTIYINRRGTAQ